MAAAGMDRFAATMVFCEAPFDGTLAPAVPTGHDDDKAEGAASVLEVASALMEAAKEYFSGPASEQQQQQQPGRDSVPAFLDAVGLEYY
ncbi:uncharacterized protein [Triticum aestivum]|uniref:uncharacterized protein n=1 Tax=Triticum aestivum TaxID=4565 RepID=UPI001D0297E1|nr:uncharacterized protein LOC123083186 [Triticum aestivum]